MTRLKLVNAASEEPIVIEAQRLILAGYTGRDRASVQRHIDELAAQGVPPPDHVPVLYPGVADAIQVDGRLPAGAGRASGEVEFVLLVTGGLAPQTPQAALPLQTTQAAQTPLGTGGLAPVPGGQALVTGGSGGIAPQRRIFVGIGSDHTDRDMEQTSIVASKQAFPKIIGGRVWPLESLLPDWDRFTLRSWVTHDGVRRLYQEGAVATMMTPDDLLHLVPVDQRGDGLVLFSGTVPAACEAPASGRCRFEGELLDASGVALATCTYEYQAA